MRQASRGFPVCIKVQLIIKKLSSGDEQVLVVRWTLYLSSWLVFSPRGVSERKRTRGLYDMAFVCLIPFAFCPGMLQECRNRPETTRNIWKNNQEPSSPETPSVCSGKAVLIHFDLDSQCCPWSKSWEKIHLLIQDYSTNSLCMLQFI